MASDRRWLVVGAGGVGGYLAGLLAHAGREVTVLARGDHLRAIRNHGLRLGRASRHHLDVPVNALIYTTIKHARPAPWLKS